MSDWKSIVHSFEPISLVEMDSVRLMNRMDTKFAFSLSTLPQVLAKIKQDYKVLEINDERAFLYISHYFDTDNFDFFHDHHRGKVNRSKVRVRNYVSSGTHFLEVKFKNNKGRTLKARNQIATYSPSIILEHPDLLSPYVNVPIENLQASIEIDYVRITFVNKHFPERVTLDLDLTFFQGEQKKSFDNLVIAEVKRDKLAHRSSFLLAMKELHIRPGSLSKYCFGVSVLNPTLKQNNFKQRIYNLTKINHVRS
jgi:hypothetical protein